MLLSIYEVLFLVVEMEQLSQSLFDVILVANHKAQLRKYNKQPCNCAYCSEHECPTGAQAGNDRHDGGGCDPFAKRFKAFSDIIVVKYNGNEGVLEKLKWLDLALKMLEQVESVINEKAMRELLNHQMIGNALGWQRTQERILGAQDLDVLTIAQFWEMFMDRYVQVLYKHRFKHKFMRYEQRERTMEQYLTKFYELSSFSLRIFKDEEDTKAMMWRTFFIVRQDMPALDEYTIT